MFNKDSKILILGSIPSVKSREEKFYYAHPQNRFWKVLANVYNEDIPITIEDKKELLLNHNIALWDVIKSCTIIGSSDSSIHNVIPNDINLLIKNSNISKIYTTGKKAYSLYNKYCFDDTKIIAINLPSTSAANAALSLDDIIKEYKKITSL